MRDEQNISQDQGDEDRMVRADELRWTLRPTTRLEDISAEEFLALEPAELLAFAADCQADLRAIRETLQQALELVARQQDQLARAARVVESQRQQLRAQREQAAA